MDNLASAPWALVTIVGVLILAVAICYGMWMNSKRTRSQRRLTEAATRREYEEEERQRPDVHMPT
jgi:hypothetical protein